MDIRKSTVEASCLGNEWSKRLGPGLVVDLDEVLQETPRLTVRDVFNEDNFEPAVPVPMFSQHDEHEGKD